MLIKSDEVDFSKYDDNLRRQVYCAFDCCVTYEVLEALLLELETQERCKYTYEFSMGLLPPALAMMGRGLRIDQKELDRAKEEVDKLTEQADIHCNQEAMRIWDRPLNPRSFKQKYELLYDHMDLPLQYGPRGKPTTDKNALADLREHAPNLIDAILEVSAVKDLHRVLNTGIDPDGRMRCSYNVSGTKTGRWSSSASCWWTGTNLQNVPKKVRNIFIPDPGYIFVECDLDRAESLCVAYLAGDENYIQAHQEHDLHAAVAYETFNIDPNQVNEICFGDKTYRDIGKRCQHALNYFAGGKTRAAKMLEKRLGLPFETALHYVERSFQRYSKVREWHNEVISIIKKEGVLITPFGRRRRFFGDADDWGVQREAISYQPQSMTADALNRAILAIWDELDGDDLQMLAQVHDSLLFQVRRDKLDLLLPRMMELMRVPVKVRDRECIIPSSYKIGDNWRDLRDGAEIGGLV